MAFQEYSDSLASKLHLGQRRMPILVGAAIIVLICALCIFQSVLFPPDGLTIDRDAEAGGHVDDVQASSEEEVSQESAPLCVHVAGCVNTPGMYQLPEGARLAEAISAAGGFTAEARTESVNLARVVQDGEQIIVSSVNVDTGGGSTQVDPSSLPSAQTTSLVNINTADEATLETISGIGPSKAKKIITYREAHGPFKTVDDLTSVSGIGEKTLASIKDQICVG